MSTQNNIEHCVTIYTDGACSGNPGPGGWGAVLTFKNNVKKIFGHNTNTTNNKMELFAAISALQNLKKPCNINLYTDSKYVQKGITEWIHNWSKNNWIKSDKKPVKNADLWKILQHEIQKHNIVWYWVKGHSGNRGNTMADTLAVQGRDEAKEILRRESL